MTLSREARILIGLLVLAAGAWVWVNFAHHEGASKSALNAAVQAAEAPPERTPSVAPTVARDVHIAELPFLVTAPPKATEVAASTNTSTSTPASGGAPTLAGAKRVSVNPFSPIIVKTAAPPSSSESKPVQVVDVPIRKPSSQGSAAVPTDAATLRQPISAPAPSAHAPAMAALGSFPRALPESTLPVVPDILMTTVAPNAVPQKAPADLASVAAISVPQVKGAPVTLAGIGSSGEATDGAQAVPAPLPLATRTAPQSKPTPPLEAGLTPLSRYLRDHNFKFTGEVLGAVGVGVFRSSSGSTPLVLALGQKLPNTDIVLTNLKGQQAEFTQGDDTQALILDLRR
jgi:hypothetical protein